MATMFSICIPRVSSHYNEVDVRDAINIGFDGEFVDTIDVRYTRDRSGQDFQVMFIHFLTKEGNEHTNNFFQRLEQNGEVKFYTGKTNRKTGERFFWKIRKIIKKAEPVPVPVPVARPGLMSDEDEAKLIQDRAAKAMAMAETMAAATTYSVGPAEKEEGEINEDENEREEEDEDESEKSECEV